MPLPSLLIVDDEEVILKQLEWAFREHYKVATAATEEDALAAIKAKKPQLMILDLSLTGDPEKLEGFRILETALQLNPLLKIMVITGHDEKENALKAIEMGAYDFFAKPIVIDDLMVILKRAAYLSKLEKELDALKKKPDGTKDFEGIIAMSQPMTDLFDTVKRVAPTDVAVLITGESGTGKELVARAIHSRSPRTGKPFIPINCGAIPENLLESELFGHERGSFTGAHASRPGKFEIADGGTIFLDEIGELPQGLQVKLLRFLQDQLIERVGGRSPIQVNVRVIAATNRELGTMLEANEFREDLFYRINTISLELPPLRARGDDIHLLAMYFLNLYNKEFAKSIRGFSADAQNTLVKYNWPGNVRELENRVKRAVIMATGKHIQPDDMDLPFPDEIDDPQAADVTLVKGEASSSLQGSSLKEAREEIERRLVTGALIRLKGNVSAAAQELEVSRPTLHDLMKKLGIDPSDYRGSAK
jgi:two-component system NtrC family response regulator